MSTKPFALLALSLPLLAACGADTARTFGFTRDAPDEFTVTTRAPLSMPPSLGNLPPHAPAPPGRRRSAPGSRPRLR